jgi:cardiolipin synthase
LRHLPNLLTLLRLLAAPFIAWLLVVQAFQQALAVAIFAGLTDWLDGYAARRLRVSGRTGAVLDPAADKALLVILFLVLGVIGRIPLWMVGLAVARDMTIVSGALLLRKFRGVRRFSPAILGKVSTFFQIVLVLLVLLRAAYPNAFDSRLALTALVLSALFTALSFIDYVRRGIVMARRTTPLQNA